MTHRAFRSYRVANPLLKARELQTSIRPVGGDEAADWAGPDGNQAIAMRSSVLDDIPNLAYGETQYALPGLASLQVVGHKVPTNGQLSPTSRCPVAWG